MKNIKNNENSVFIPGSVAYFLNSFDGNELEKKLRKTIKSGEIGRQRYACIERSPHCYLVACATDKGVTTKKFIELCKEYKIPIETKSLPKIINELKTLNLITEKSNKFYATKTAYSIFKKTGLTSC